VPGAPLSLAMTAPAVCRGLHAASTDPRPAAAAHPRFLLLSAPPEAVQVSAAFRIAKSVCVAVFYGRAAAQRSSLSAVAPGSQRPRRHGRRPHGPTQIVVLGLAPPGAVKHPLRSPVEIRSKSVLCGAFVWMRRALNSKTKHGGFRPGFRAVQFRLQQFRTV
jgi:hypothetical protein